MTSSAAAPSTSVQVITESGAVVTRTVIYSPTQAASQPERTNGSSNNTGAIVGGVVGGVAAIAAVVGGILFFLWRRKKQHRAEQEHQAGITRNTSTMSKVPLQVIPTTHHRLLQISATVAVGMTVSRSVRFPDRNEDTASP